MSTDKSFERTAKERGLNAPRVTPAEIDAAIVERHFFTAGEGVLGSQLESARKNGVTLTYSDATEHEPLANLTICVLVLANGFTVIGHSAPASPANFRTDLGREIAERNAKEQLWPLLGYALRDKLAAGDEVANVREGVARQLEGLAKAVRS